MNVSMSLGTLGLARESAMISGGLIQGTLDRLNSNPYGSYSSSNNLDYQFQKDVLSAYYSARGAAVNAFA